MIGFAGLSHLGIVSCVAAAAKGYEVTACDTSSSLCEELTRGHLPILEPGLSELLTANSHRLHFTVDPAQLSNCDVVCLSMDVPTNGDNRSNLTGVQQLARSVAPHLRPGATLVVLSQVPPGFTRRLTADLQAILKSRSIRVFCQVETLIFGAAVERALHPERFIIGGEDGTAPLPRAYAEWLSVFGCPILRMGYESAELAKISINVFLAASISTANTLAELCESVGADWAEIVPTLRLDRRIGPYAYLTPGLGIAGGNIERDLATVRSLAAEYGAEDCVAASFLAHSEHRRNWVLRALHRHVFTRESHPVVAVWGLAYKPNTRSTKNAPSLALLESLRGTRVQLYDPQATLGPGYPDVVQVASALDACRNAHALVIMTAWEEFAAVSLTAARKTMAQAVVIDPSAVWRRRDPAIEGFVYLTLGRDQW